MSVTQDALEAQLDELITTLNDFYEATDSIDPELYTYEGSPYCMTTEVIIIEKSRHDTDGYTSRMRQMSNLNYALSREQLKLTGTL